MILNMVRGAVVAATGVVFAAAGLACAAGEFDDLAPYLGEDVVAVGYVDLTAVDIPAAFAEMQQLAGEVPGVAPGDVASHADEAQQWVEQMIASGAGRMYAVLRLSDVTYVGPVWVLPLADDADAARVMGLLLSGEANRADATRGNRSEILPNVCREADGAVLGAMNDAQLDSFVKQRPAAPRRDAAEALAALERVDAGLAAFGNDDSRRVLRELFPRLPAPFEEIDGPLAADGVQWVALTANLPPKFAVAATIDAADRQSAETLQGAAVKGIELLKGLCMAAMVTGDGTSRGDAAMALPMLGLLKPTLEGERLTISLGEGVEELRALRAALAPAFEASREAARRSARMNKFKQLALGMLNYESARKSYPPAASYDSAGRPLLSWRVHILPYIEQGALYNEFHLDEPWDSEHNRKLIERMPEIYADPDPSVRKAVGGSGRTTFVVPVGEATVFHGREGTKIREVSDGTSNTILLVEVIPERAVVWTKPDDWEVDFSDPLRGVKREGGERRGDIFAAAWCDGSVRVVSNGVDAKAFAALLTRQGED